MKCNTCTSVAEGSINQLNPCFIVLGSKTYANLYIGITVVECKQCSARYYVLQDPGGNTPNYSWYTDKVYIETMCGEKIEDMIRK